MIPRRPPAWLAELMYAQPEVAEMIGSIQDKVSPEAQERVLAALRRSKMGERIADEGRSEGLGPVEHQFARRLGRSLVANERAELLRRLDTLGASRIGDVVLDLERDALAAWLADPDAR